jgi:hypothetical protein
MNVRGKLFILLAAFGLAIGLTSVLPLSAQPPAATSGAESAQQQHDPLADLSQENRALFDAIREASQQDRDADVLANGKKLLPALQVNTRLADFVTEITAIAAVETGDLSDALTLIKPFVDAHPKDWRALSTLVRVYAESGEKAQRDQQLAQLIALHKHSLDPDFTKLHIFPIQKVNLHSGYVVFLYPFEPLTPFNSYLEALVFTSNGKQEYRIELESMDADQAFFKAKKPGERRFSIDTFHQNEKNPNWPESQALNGFVDGVFDYDAMRDKMIAVANDKEASHK